MLGPQVGFCRGTAILLSLLRSSSSSCWAATMTNALQDVLVEAAAAQEAPASDAVADAPVNLLAYNRPYDAVGRTTMFSCQPAELHFRGFQPGEPVRQVVQIRNISGAKARVIIVPPASVNFKVVDRAGMGSLAPGLCQQLVVEFTGQRLQHYRDNILVHTQDGGLAIPLHAYPATGSLPLPKQLDLGNVPLGETLSYKLQLDCAASVDFTFAITVLQHNTHFAVHPMCGSVPAHGSACVTVAFTPTRYSTEHMQLEVQLSEYGAGPMQVLVTGCCRPGMVQEQIKATLLKQAATEGGVQGGNKMEQDQAPRTAKAAGMRASHHPVSGSQSASPDVGLADHHPITLHEVNMLLNQRPGKLQTKDIKAAILARKQELGVEQQRLQAALDVGIRSGLDPLDQPVVQPDIKEALFQWQLSQAEAGARHCTGLVAAKEGARVGAMPPASEELAKMSAARTAALAQLEEEKQQHAMHRLQLELKTSGATHVLQEPVSSRNNNNSTQLGAVSMSRVTYPGLESFQPQWLLLSESNDWRKRVQVTQRFVHAARVVIHRNRAQARLRKLRALAARLRGSKDGLAGQVLQDLVLEGSGEVQRPGVAPLQLMMPHMVRPTELPAYCPQDHVQHTQVERGLYADFSALQPQPYKAEFEYKLLGYNAEEIPSWLAYVPLCQDQPLLNGGAEDVPGGMQCGVLPDCVASLPAMDAMPQFLLASPYPSRSLEFGVVQVPTLAPAWGLDPEQLLQPCMYSHTDDGSEPPGLGSVKALAACSTSQCRTGSS